jgi:Toastrack DUF4097
MRTSLSAALAVVTLSAVTVSPIQPAAAQTVAGKFDRSFTVSGPAELDVRTNSGSIGVRRGTAGSIHVRGEIRVSSRWRAEVTDAEIRGIEQNPPVTQSGNLVRIDRLEDGDRWRGVSISYEITVPENTTVRASTGSGSILVNGVTQAVTANTGSGSIRVENIGGEVDAHTGSGSIDADGVTGAFRAVTGSGSVTATLRQAEADVSSGSGEIRVTGVRGRVAARTGSGSIAIDGNPTADWVVRSSSGEVTVRLPSDARFELRARTGSGHISSDHPVTVNTTSRRSLEGQVRGGGPRVELSTSSGTISIR